MQVALHEAQEEAVQAAFSVFNSEAVGNGPVRRNFEKQLHSTLKRQFEVRNDSLSFCICIVSVMSSRFCFLQKNCSYCSNCIN